MKLGKNSGKIAIDVRMMRSSGIGTYIRNLVPRILDSRPETQFYLLGRPSEMKEWHGFNKPNARLIHVKSPIFTVREQLEMAVKIPGDTNLFWSPNYNIPVFYRGKLMVTVHDVFHLAMGTIIRGWHRRLYAKAMFRLLTRRTDQILCVSEFTKRELERWAGGNPDRMEVIPNGLEDSWFAAPPPGRPHPKPYLLFVGNVKPHKNLGRLLKVFDAIKNRIPHDLVLVGQTEGFITGDAEALREAEKFGDRVHVAGLVDEGKLRQYYASAEMLVFPSWYEGFGFPPLEAMACGCPVAASHIASIPEVCADAVSYFDPLRMEDMAEKILEVIRDRGLRETLRQKGLRRAKEFSWEKTALETGRCIERVFG